MLAKQNKKYCSLLSDIVVDAKGGGKTGKVVDTEKIESN